MTRADLIVERDWLLERGVPLKAVEHRERLWLAALTVAEFARWRLELRPGESCPCCRRSAPMTRRLQQTHNSRCDLVLAVQALCDFQDQARIVERVDR